MQEIHPIQVHISSAFRAEKEYIIRTLFQHYLGVPVEINISDSNNYIVNLGGNILEIGNQSFKNGNKPYMSTENLPQNKQFADYDTLGRNLPVLYGSSRFEACSDRIYIDSDIFAACFFMLTRWEEVLEQDKDLHGRAKAANSIAFKWSFLHRPIVDEYVDLLWNCLRQLGYQGDRKTHNFEFVHTHDVDEIEKWKGRGTLARTIAGDVVKRKSVRLATDNIKQQKSVRKGTSKDPYDTFDELMDLSEKHGVTSHFFFLQYGASSYDNGYDLSHPLVCKSIKRIKKREHNIGLHPSYNTVNDHDLFRKEKEELETFTNRSIITGRQHYLRFKTPETWQMWEDLGMQWDSTMYYSEKAGFRSGTCRDHPVFNVLSRSELKLSELPLTIMDSTYFNQIESGKTDAAFDEIMDFINTVKKHQGKFVLLWHTNYLNLNIYNDHKELYLQLLNNL